MVNMLRAADSGDNSLWVHNFQTTCLLSSNSLLLWKNTGYGHFTASEDSKGESCMFSDLKGTLAQKASICSRAWNEPSRPHYISCWQVNLDTFKGELIVSRLCTTGATSPHGIQNALFTWLKTPSVENSFPLLWAMFTSRWKPPLSFVNWITSCPQWEVPTLCVVIMFGNTNHTNLPLELPNDKQQMTCPGGPNTGAEFHVRPWCLPPATADSAGTVWPHHAAPLRDCF